MNELDGRKMDRKALEEIRIRAVKRVEAGESPEVVIKALGLTRPRIYEWGVIYEENGVKISSFPAIHVLDGSVSFRLDWNNRSFVFGGDSFPNKWFVKYAKGAELVVHECFFTPENWLTKAMDHHVVIKRMRLMVKGVEYFHHQPHIEEHPPCQD